MFTNKEKVHLIGIGGIGMSGIAQILLAFGCKISGSDLKYSSLTRKLEDLGAKIFIGHSADNIKDVDVVIYSAAIKQNNPELITARSQGIAVLGRAEALSKLANQKKSIAITGAHGKTTTSSLIAHMLVKSGLKPTVCVGGELFSLNGNAFLGEDDYFVLEADESDGSFLHLAPFYSVITNIDREHLDYYKDLKQITQTFAKFMHNTNEKGCIIFCQDDQNLLKIVLSLDRENVSFGLSSEAEIFAQDIRIEEGRSYFECFHRGKALGEIILNIPGRHNISNSLAALALGLKLGLDFKSIQQALSSYSGVGRRMELKLKSEDLLIVDDYAHHPAEIRASLEALKSFKHRRVLCVFQPHRYTRTKFLIDDFGSCFQGVDHLVITNIYAASEAPIKGVSARNICQKAKQANVKDVHFLPMEAILAHLIKEIQPGDLVAIMGAGDIGSISDALVREYQQPYPV